jgi:hypothetical protein
MEDVDEENEYFGARVLKVDGKFSTPFRVPSSVDYGSKQQLPTPIKIDSEISEVTINFRSAEYEQFTSQNGPFSNRIAQIEEKADLMSYSSLVSYYPQIPKAITPDKKGMWLLLRLGMFAEGINIISVPDFEPENSYEHDLQQYCEGIRDYKKEPMPILDMGLDHELFKKKFDQIVSNVETDLVKVIGLIYRNYSKHILNYYHILENKNKKVLYYAVDVQRKFENQAATMHILQSFGIDLYSTRFMRGGGGANEKKIRDVDIFDKSAVGVLKLNEYSQKHEDNHLNCNCPVCQGATLDEFIDKHGYNGNDELDGYQLQYAGKLHEFFASSNEFDISRKHIIENELLDYFSSKEYLETQRRDENNPMI